MPDELESRSIFPVGKLPKPEVEDGPWDERVAYRGSGEDESARRFGYILVRVPFVPRPHGTSDQEQEDATRAALEQVLDAAGVPAGELKPLAGRWWTVGVPSGEEPYWADRVEDEGLPAEVDHVLFSDEMRADTFMASPFGASPFGGESVWRESVWGESVWRESVWARVRLGRVRFGRESVWGESVRGE